MAGAEAPVAATASLLRAEHLSRTVNQSSANQKTLVDDVSLDVNAGETLAIVGPSGSGKSSLLRLLNRLDEPTSGAVYVNGQDYRRMAPRDLRAKLGMVMQRPYLFPGTVEENLKFGPSHRGVALTKEAVHGLLAEVGLGGYGDRDVTHLSGGEAQRVALARTLANSPLLLLLDEPTSALDDASKVEVESLLLKIVRDQHLTCILVTHDTAQAFRVAQTALVLELGRVVRMGPVDEVLNA